MSKKIKAISISIITFLLISLTFTSKAVPWTFWDPTHGQCDIFGENQYHYLYLCEDGAVLYIDK